VLLHIRKSNQTRHRATGLRKVHLAFTETQWAKVILVSKNRHSTTIPIFVQGSKAANIEHAAVLSMWAGRNGAERAERVGHARVQFKF
jgi:hypothetical protein